MEFWIVVFFSGTGRRIGGRDPEVFYRREDADSFIEGHNHSTKMMGVGSVAVLYHAIGIEV